MKKSKLALSIVAGLASITALASCSEVKPVYSAEGYVLTYKDSSGSEIHYTAEELFGSLLKDSSNVSSVFDKVYKLIVRNYFEVEGAGISKLADIKKDAANDVEGVKSTANKNAESNKTSYDEEFEKLLENYSCEDEAELLEHFIYEREHTEFEKQFYDEQTIFTGKTGVEYLRDAKLAANGYEGYLEKKAPYHVRHILVKFNGSSADDKFWDDTIDAKDAKNLWTVVSQLAAGELDFGQIAENSSEFSDGSASKYGDLGIMDKDTSFVNEFKLGIYAYENLYGPNAAKAKASEISISSADTSYADVKGQKGIDITDRYSKAVTYTGTKYDSGVTKDLAGDASGIATIPYGAFKAINDWANTTNTKAGEVVNEGNAVFYPRNVIYNKYLNRHNVAFITPNVIPSNVVDAEGDYSLTDENTVGYNDGVYEAKYDEFAALGGFRSGIIEGQKVLCTKNGDPILVVRAGSGDYHGIHFIVIQKSAMADDLSDYYSVKYPGQEGYIQPSTKATYVNFLNQGTKEIKARAEEVSGKIKGFDSSNINKLIYASYKDSQKLEFRKFKVGETEVDLGEYIDNWIKVNKTKSDFDAGNSWESTWESYLNQLDQQKVERRKLVSEVCAIGFTTNNVDKGANWNTVGGRCYVPTQK